VRVERSKLAEDSGSRASTLIVRQLIAAMVVIPLSVSCVYGNGGGQAGATRLRVGLEGVMWEFRSRPDVCGVEAARVVSELHNFG
jgi:hypothetical protein